MMDKHSTEARRLVVKKSVKAGPRLLTPTIVKGLLTSGGLSVVYGAPKAGKTFLAVDLALRVAAGMPWHGRRVTPGSVLYLALEGGTGIERRICAWHRHHEIAADIPFAWASQSIDLRTARGDMEAILGAARGLDVETGVPIRLVVIDTLARALAGGSDCDPEHMGAVIKAADEIRAATGAHVMIIHHTGKDAERGARGWSGLTGALDTQIEVTKGENGHRARVTDQRDMEEGGVFAFALEVVELGQDEDGDPVTTCVAEEVQAGAELKPKGNGADQLTGQMRLAYSKLIEVGAAPDCPRTAWRAGMPDGVHPIPVEAWRQSFYASLADAEPAAKRQAFNRAVTDLQNRHLIGKNDDLVWIVERDMIA